MADRIISRKNPEPVQNARKMKSAASEAEPPQARPRALVVEDDPSWQQILGEILVDMGLEVDLADSYPSAVERLRGSLHRVAVLDLSLGGTDHRNQDGLSVAESVRRIDPVCRVLFLTGFATVELAVQVMKDFGALTCLRKEVFRRSEFRTAINDALAQAPAAESQAARAQVSDATIPALASGGAEKESQTGVALVIEDDAGWRSLLSELLEDAGYSVQTSSSYVEALGLLKREQFRLAVVDLSLASSLSKENLDGYRLLTNFNKASVPVIVVSGYAEPARIEQAYRERLIVACLEKQSFDRKAFLQRIEEARSVGDSVFQSLTDREREVLVLLAQGLTNKEIAYHLTITQNTVKRHLKSLFAKLGVTTRAAASAKAVRMGIRDQALGDQGEVVRKGGLRQAGK